MAHSFDLQKNLLQPTLAQTFDAYQELLASEDTSIIRCRDHWEMVLKSKHPVLAPISKGALKQFSDSLAFGPKGFLGSCYDALETELTAEEIQKLHEGFGIGKMLWAHKAERAYSSLGNYVTHSFSCLFEGAHKSVLIKLDDGVKINLFPSGRTCALTISAKGTDTNPENIPAAAEYTVNISYDIDNPIIGVTRHMTVQNLEQNATWIPSSDNGILSLSIADDLQCITETEVIKERCIIHGGRRYGITNGCAKTPGGWICHGVY
jgi:hypothetical protein